MKLASIATTTTEMARFWDSHGSHDCHKHGKLARKSAVNNPKGMAEGRLEPTTDFGFFADHTLSNGPLTPYEGLAVILNDGTQREVFKLLRKALQAWEAELKAPEL
ncbi:hypothetical protein [Methylobacterium sp. E-045]|uniref:hypothetical protein n=1 Tax=Methylobacterium sp. E-045 TaxID=2836575 RepID=UPI001FB9C59D|nr:hypothetical protein [Methylobacterium sp. E-045]MCJ2127890.1 hypothetical protein [Methylobacterium sp. E-045]